MNEEHQHVWLTVTLGLGDETYTTRWDLCQLCPAVRHRMPFEETKVYADHTQLKGWVRAGRMVLSS